MANNAGVFSQRSTAGPVAIGPDGGDSLFVPVLANRGPSDIVTLITSFPRYQQIFGNETVFADGTRMSEGWEAIKAFFARGGKRAYVVRIVGSSAVVAESTIEDRDGSPVDTLTIEAKGAGTWGNNIHVVVADGTETETFKLTVYDGDPTGSGVELEEFDNLKMLSGDLATVNSQSNYIQLVDEESATDAPDNRPATGTYQLGTDGSDQTAGVDDNAPDSAAIVGTESVGVKTGLKCFREYVYGRGWIDAAGLDQIDTPGDVITELQQQAATYNRLYGVSSEEGAAYADAVTQRAQYDSVFAFFVWPRKRVVDQFSGELKTVSVISELAAAHMKAVQQDALAKVPAGRAFPVGNGSIGLETQNNGQPLIDDTVAETLRAQGINPVYNRDRTGPKCWGNRAATTENAWRSISAAYIYNYISDNGRDLLDQLIYDDIDDRTFYSDIETTFFDFLGSMYDAGAFRGVKPQRGEPADPQSAGFSVTCSEDLLSEADLANDIVRVQIWFRERRSAETIFLEIARQTAV